MLSTSNTQSLSDFRKKAAKTIDRLNKTGNAEILTVNGEARAVLVSPAVYDEMAKETQLAHDIAVMRRSIEQFKQGKAQEVNSFFSELRTKLLSMQPKPNGRKTKGKGQ
jgi:PHD/YefM family antitoxin component YafN of YafNO toxin-antitoxin module